MLTTQAINDAKLPKDILKVIEDLVDQSNKSPTNQDTEKLLDMCKALLKKPELKKSDAIAEDLKLNIIRILFSLNNLDMCYQVFKSKLFRSLSYVVYVIENNGSAASTISTVSTSDRHTYTKHAENKRKRKETRELLAIILSSFHAKEKAERLFAGKNGAGLNILVNKDKLIIAINYLIHQIQKKSKLTNNDIQCVTNTLSYMKSIEYEHITHIKQEIENSAERLSNKLKFATIRTSNKKIKALKDLQAHIRGKKARDAFRENKENAKNTANKKAACIARAASNSAKIASASAGELVTEIAVVQAAKYCAANAAEIAMTAAAVALSTSDKATNTSAKVAVDAKDAAAAEAAKNAARIAITAAAVALSTSDKATNTSAKVAVDAKDAAAAEAAKNAARIAITAAADALSTSDKATNTSAKVAVDAKDAAAAEAEAAKNTATTAMTAAAVAQAQTEKDITQAQAKTTPQPNVQPPKKEGMLNIQKIIDKIIKDASAQKEQKKEKIDITTLINMQINTRGLKGDSLPVFKWRVIARELKETYPRISGAIEKAIKTTNQQEGGSCSMLKNTSSLYQNPESPPNDIKEPLLPTNDGDLELDDHAANRSNNKKRVKNNKKQNQRPNDEIELRTPLIEPEKENGKEKRCCLMM